MYGLEAQYKGGENMVLSIDELGIILIALVRLRKEYKDPAPIDDLINQFMREYRYLVNVEQYDM